MEFGLLDFADISAGERVEIGEKLRTDSEHRVQVPLRQISPLTPRKNRSYIFTHFRKAVRVWPAFPDGSTFAAGQTPRRRLAGPSGNCPPGFPDSKFWREILPHPVAQNPGTGKSAPAGESALLRFTSGYTRRRGSEKLWREQERMVRVVSVLLCLLIPSSKIVRNFGIFYFIIPGSPRPKNRTL